MTTVIFETESSEIPKIKSILKALGVKKIKIENSLGNIVVNEDKVKYSKKEFSEMLVLSKKNIVDDVLKTEDDVRKFITSI